MKGKENIDSSVPKLESIATCDAGDSATGGGYLVSSVDVTVVDTTPEGGNSWSVFGVAAAGCITCELRAVVQCFDNSP